MIAETSILGKVLNGIIVGILVSNSDKLLKGLIHDRYTAFIKHQGKFVNHDLEKALRRSFLMAQYSIAIDCRRELVKSSRMIYRGSSRIGSLEREADIRLLNKKLKNLKEELKQVKQLKKDLTPIESLYDVGFLVTGNDYWEQKSIDVKRKLVAEAVKDICVVEYKAKTEATLVERICAYFSFEIKTNSTVKDILQTQFLAEIHSKSEDLEKSVQHLINNLENLWLVIQSNFDRVKTRIEDVLQVVTGMEETVEKIEEKVDHILKAQSLSPTNNVYVIVINGDIETIKTQLQSIIASVQQASGDLTTTLIDIKKGSVLLFFDGSQEGFEQLQVLFKSGELQQILGVPVETVECIAEDTPINKTAVNLSQWLHNIIEGGWQTVEEVLSTQRTNLVFAARNDSPSLGVLQAKQFYLGTKPTGTSLALIVGVTINAAQQRNILLQVHPVGSKTYLPSGLKCLVLDTSGKILREVQAKGTDRWIQLKISGEPEEQFDVQIQLNHLSITEHFII